MGILGGKSSQVLETTERVLGCPSACRQSHKRISMLQWSKAMNIKRIAYSINNVENIFLLFAAALNNLGGMIDVSAGPLDLRRMLRSRQIRSNDDEP